MLHTPQSDVQSDVAVITPLYNGERHISACLASVQRQTAPAAVHIVVDDGSSDDSASVARAFAAEHPGVVVIEQANGGAARARDSGLAALPESARFILFLDHDDELLPTAVASLRDALERRPDAVAACGRAYLIGDDGTSIDADASGRPPWWIPGASRPVTRRTRRELADEITYEVMAFWCAVLTPGLTLVRREVADRVGGFDPLLPVTADYDYWIRVARLGPIALTNDVVLKYRVHATQLSAQLEAMRSDIVFTHIKTIAEETMGPQPLAPLGRHQMRHFEVHRVIDKIDLARESLRSRRYRAAVLDLGRALRSVGEAALRLVPVAGFHRRRYARARRRRLTANPFSHSTGGE